MVYSTKDIYPPTEDGLTLLEKAIRQIKTLKQSNNGDRDLNTSGHNADYGVVYKNGEIHQWGYPCHKMFAFVKTELEPVFSFSKNKRWRASDRRTTRYKSARAYFDWITHPEESPWREVLYYEGTDLALRDRTFMWDHGFIFNLDKLPSNMHHSFMVASRTQKEWPYLVDTWYELVTEYGFTEAWAYAFITLWSYEYQWPYSFKGFLKQVQFKPCVDNFYDFPLDMSRCDEDYVLNFLRGKMVGPRNKPLSQSAVYTPVNSLWGRNDLKTTDPASFMNLFHDRYKNLHQDIKVKKIDGWSGKEYEQIVKGMSLSGLIESGLKEQERLYGLL